MLLFLGSIGFPRKRCCICGTPVWFTVVSLIKSSQAVRIQEGLNNYNSTILLMPPATKYFPAVAHLLQSLFQKQGKRTHFPRVKIISLSCLIIQQHITWFHIVSFSICIEAFDLSEHCTNSKVFSNSEHSVAQTSKFLTGLILSPALQFDKIMECKSFCAYSAVQTVLCNRSCVPG